MFKLSAAVGVMCLLLTGCDYSTSCKSEVDKAVSENITRFNTDVMKLQIEQAKGNLAVQNRIIEICLSKGGVPVFQSGNIGCQGH